MSDDGAGNRRARRSAAAKSAKKPVGAKMADALKSGGNSVAQAGAKAAAKPDRLKILHLHSTFNRGGKEARCVQLINLWGSAAEHHIVSATPGAMDACGDIKQGIACKVIDNFPQLTGGISTRRYHLLARAMAGFDLVLTYNWGAMDAVMANALYGRRMGLPPLVHHEDGFNEDEARKLKWTRNLFRSLALSRADAVVVPSKRLEAIARTVWKRPADRLFRIANGIETAAYQHQPANDAIPAVIKRPGERWVGTLAGLRTVKNLPRLVRAFSALADPWQLVILGEGPEEAAIRAEASRLGIDDRVHLPGYQANPADYIGLFDIFSLSSDSEQFPISVVEAMAAGLPVVSPAVGDVADIVSSANAPFITPASDEAALSAALVTLAGDEALRFSLGEANRSKALASYDQAQMLRSYAAVYASAMGRNSFP